MRHSFYFLLLLSASVCFLKVMAYVLSHDDLRQHLESTVVHPEGADGSDDGSGSGGDGAADVGGGAGVASPSRETPEDLVEVLCGNRVVEPHLYIGALCVRRREGGREGGRVF